jgi:hypothetical protein
VLEVLLLSSIVANVTTGANGSFKKACLDLAFVLECVRRRIPTALLNSSAALMGHSGMQQVSAAPPLPLSSAPQQVQQAKADQHRPSQASKKEQSEKEQRSKKEQAPRKEQASKKEQPSDVQNP